MMKMCTSSFEQIQALTCSLIYLAENDGGSKAQEQNLVITDEHFDRVTYALVMRLRQLEETAEQEGISQKCDLTFHIL